MSITAQHPIARISFPVGHEGTMIRRLSVLIGDGHIEVKVNRGPGSSAISITGDIILEDGYAGRCMQ